MSNSAESVRRVWNERKMPGVPIHRLAEWNEWVPMTGPDDFVPPAHWCRRLLLGRARNVTAMWRRDCVVWPFPRHPTMQWGPTIYLSEPTRGRILILVPQLRRELICTSMHAMSSRSTQHLIVHRHLDRTVGGPRQRSRRLRASGALTPRSFAASD
jgi:hypothetical protein